MNHDFDLVIVGAGPAGCICAYLLAGKGLRIAVIEKSIFPRDKICGDALSPDVINQLQRISPELARDFLQNVTRQPASGIRFVAPNFKALDIQFTNPNNPEAGGYIAKRMDFDHFLFRQILGKPGIEVMQGCKVDRIELAHEDVLVKTGSETLRAKMVVGADGANSIVSRQLSDNRIDRDHYCAGVRQYYQDVAGFEGQPEVELHFYRELLPGYFWIFKLPNRQANVGLGILSGEISRRKLDLKAMLNDLVQHHPNLKERFKQARPLEDIQGFGLPIGSRKVACSGERFLLLGDAAHLIDPFTGEGIGNAIRSGRIAAEHLSRAVAVNRFDAAFHQQYDREIYRRMWTELRVSRSMQKMLYYPRIFNFLVNKANKNESVRTLLTSMLTDLDLRKELRRPSFYTKLLFS